MTKFQPALPLILAVALSGCASVYDGGGDVRERAKEVATAEPGELPDICLSACLMGLRVHCVKPTALLLFHGPQSTEPWADGAYQAWVNAISNYYPAELGEWYRAEGHNGTHIKSGAEAIAMGATPCGKDKK